MLATPMKPLRIKDEPFGWWLLLGLVAGAIAIFAGYWIFSKIVYTSWKAGANVGETFGVLSSLFSVLAFAGVLFTILQDRKARSRRTKIEAYDALLRSIETQFRAAASSGASVTAIGDLLAKQRLYSEELEILITEKSTETLLTNEQIASAFAKIPWFTRDDLLARAPGLRQRLRRWSILSAEDLDAMVDDQAIRNAIRDLYVHELKRNAENPFDPDALAIWGGMLYRQGLTEDVLAHIRYALHQSPEWKSKHPESH